MKLDEGKLLTEKQAKTVKSIKKRCKAQGLGMPTTDIIAAAHAEVYDIRADDPQKLKHIASTITGQNLAKPNFRAALGFDSDELKTSVAEERLCPLQANRGKLGVYFPPMRQVVLAALLLLSNFSHPQDIPPRLRIADASVATLHIAGNPDFLAPDGKDVWVTNEGRVEKLTMNTTKPVMTVPVPWACGGLIVAFESLWVASCHEQTIYRVNTKSGQILDRIATGLADPEGELSLAAGADSIWLLTQESGVLSRIDPHTNKVIQKIDVKAHSYAAAFGFGRVWITNTGLEDSSKVGTVQCIDPNKNQVVATIKVGPKPRFLAAGVGAIWVLNQGDGTVTRIDPDTLKVLATIPTEIIGSGGDIDAGLGRVWVHGKNILLEVIDPRTNQLKSRFDPPSGSGAVRVADDLLWVTAHDIETVWVLRPQN